MQVITRKKVLKIKGKGDRRRFCRLEVELRQTDKGPELSVCGSEGDVLSPRRARQEARRTWESYFEESPNAIREMNEQWGKNFRTPRSAATFVLNTDGEFHGVDSIGETDRGAQLCVRSCGQIREELNEWFPEHSKFFGYHLNGMQTGCAHQRALGWGHGKDIAITKQDATEAQRESLRKEAERKAEQKALMQGGEVYETLMGFARKPARIRPWLRVTFGEGYSEGHVSTLGQMAKHLAAGGRNLLDKDTFTRVAKIGGPRGPTLMKTLIDRAVSKEMQGWEVESKIYKDSLGAPCPECGYRYGSAWLYEPLPQEVIDWVESL